MAKEAEQGQPTPAVVPGYGEADDEAASMNEAAREEEGGQPGTGSPALSPSDAAEKIVPGDAGPVGYGTTETNVKQRIAEAAARAALKGTGAG